MGNGLVFVGIPRERTYIPAFVDNRDRILSRLNQAGRYCGLMQAEGHRVDMNRDVITEGYLEHPRKPEWLLLLDSDMEHPDDAAERLVRWNVPVVGGLYFYRHEEHQPEVFRFAGPKVDKWERTIYTWNSMRQEVYEFLVANGATRQDGAFAMDNVQGNPLLECDAIGAGCLLIHRDVLAAMDPPWWEYPHGWSSEDLEFCKRVKDEQGIPIYADLSTVSGHFVQVPVSAGWFAQLYERRLEE